MRIATVSGKQFHTSPRHIFMQHGINPIFAEDMQVGWNIGEDQVAAIERVKKGMWLYDPLNVKGGHVYVHDGSCMSHNSFNQTTSTLIDMEFLQLMTAESPIEVTSDVKVYERPVEGHEYILVADVSKGRGIDFSTISVVDVTQLPYKQVATYRDNNVSPMIFPNLIHKVAQSYNNAFTIIEANAGEVVFKILYYDLEYENVFTSKVANGRSMGLEINRKVKRMGTTNLKDLIERGKLKIVDEDTIKEFYVYEARRESFEARDGHHDDMIAGLVMLAWFSDTDMFGDMTTNKLRNMMNEEKRALIEKSIPALGFLPDDEAIELLEMWGEIDNNVKWTVESVHPDWDINKNSHDDPWDFRL